jgi:hypothetical protein
MWSSTGQIHLFKSKLDSAESGLGLGSKMNARPIAQQLYDVTPIHVDRLDRKPLVQKKLAEKRQP